MTFVKLISSGLFAKGKLRGLLFCSKGKSGCIAKAEGSATCDCTLSKEEVIQGNGGVIFSKCQDCLHPASKHSGLGLLLYILYFFACL